MSHLKVSLKKSWTFCPALIEMTFHWSLHKQFCRQLLLALLSSDGASKFWRSSHIDFAGVRWFHYIFVVKLFLSSFTDFAKEIGQYRYTKETQSSKCSKRSQFRLECSSRCVRFNCGALAGNGTTSKAEIFFLCECLDKTRNWTPSAECFHVWPRYL